jgi:DNA helicase-2/ATP-dependent DNA helicase PcrA
MPAKKPTPKPITLNEEQQEVVNAREGFWCCLAGPGSGKSACLVSRYAALIEEGISPDDILSLSFTQTASKNLQTRVEDKVGKLEFSRIAGARTFHSLSLAFAQQERDAYPFELQEFPLAPEPAARKLCADAARRHEVDPRALFPEISLYRRRRVGPPQAVSECENRLDAKGLKLALAYKEYCKKAQEAGLLSFDDLIYYAVEIMEKKPEVRSRWKRNWLQLDESQDMSRIEWDLVRLISGKSVLAVGDISQGIYGFRGSDPGLFASMKELFPGTQTMYLACNYRSTPEIIDFIRPIAISKELAEKFHTNNSSGPVPEVKGFLSAGDEAKWVVSQIQIGLS